MKNALLKSFFALLVLCNIAFFGYISNLLLDIKAIVLLLSSFDFMLIILAVILAAVLISFLVYYFKHRDKKELVTTVEFSSPDDMTPAEVGFLIDGVVDGSDISSMLVYWAGKKYVEISNDKKNQKMTKLVDKLPDDAKDYEKVLFNKIFGTDKEVFVKNISKKIDSDQTVTNVVKAIEKNVGDKYFDSSTITYRQFFICFFAAIFYFALSYCGVEYYLIFGILAVIMTGLFILCADWVLNYYDYRHKNNAFKGRVVSFVFFLILMGLIAAACFILFMLLGYYFEAFFLLAICVVMLFSVLLSRKIRIYTKEGGEKLGKIIGFKEFIDTAEADRIKMMVEKNPNLYYDVLPYAYVLGVSDKWIKNLDVIQNDYPNIVDKKMLSSLIVYSILLSTTSVGILNILNIASSGFKSVFLGSKKQKFD